MLLVCGFLQSSGGAHGAQFVCWKAGCMLFDFRRYRNKCFYSNGCVFQQSYDVLEKIKQALKSTLKLLLGRWGWSLICHILCHIFTNTSFHCFFSSFYWKFLSRWPHFSSLLQICCQLPSACSLDPPPSTTLPFQPLYSPPHNSPHNTHLSLALNSFLQSTCTVLGSPTSSAKKGHSLFQIPPARNSSWGMVNVFLFDRKDKWLYF